MLRRVPGYCSLVRTPLVNFIRVGISATDAKTMCGMGRHSQIDCQPKAGDGRGGAISSAILFSGETITVSINGRRKAEINGRCVFIIFH